MKSSIIAVETTEQEVDDDDFFQDNAEVTDFVNAHRGSEMLPTDGEPQGECLLSRCCVAPTGTILANLLPITLQILLT